jgi:MFS family permease
VDAAAARPASPWLAFSVVAVGAFMSTLDGNIVNVALPTIGAELGAPVGRLAWVVNAYVLAITATLLVMGRLGDRLGHRALYAGGLLVFTAGSALCGLAPGLGALVAARALQALGASAVIAIGSAVVTAAFPPDQRGRALGAMGTVIAAGLTAGPPVGGLVVASLSWRWVFYVNVPVGLAGAAWALRILPRGGGAAGGPLLDLGILRRPSFAWGIVAGFLSYVAMFTQTLLTPFLLTRVLALPPGRVGLVLVSVPVALSVTSPVSGWIADRLGGRWLPVAGMAVLSVALVLLSLAGAGDPVSTIVARLALAGVGMGMFQSPNNAAVMTALPRDRLGTGGGLLATARNAGMAAGIGIAAASVALAGGSDGHFLAGWARSLRAGAGVALLAAAIAALAARHRGAPPPASAFALPGDYRPGSPEPGR